MFDIQDRLNDLKDRIAKASQEEARNDVLRERAQSERVETMNLLKDEFGVSTVEEAISLKSELEEKLTVTAREVEQLLNALEA